MWHETKKAFLYAIFALKKSSIQMSPIHIPRLREIISIITLTIVRGFVITKHTILWNLFFLNYSSMLSAAAF